MPPVMHKSLVGIILITNVFPEDKFTAFLVAAAATRAGSDNLLMLKEGRTYMRVMITSSSKYVRFPPSPSIRTP